MATNLALDQQLLERAFLLSGEATKKAAVTRALQEFIARREQKRVAELFGTLDWDASFDYKAERSRESWACSSIQASGLSHSAGMENFKRQKLSRCATRSSEQIRYLALALSSRHCYRALLAPRHSTAS